MFTLAQYVFGIGKSDDPSIISNPSNETCASNSNNTAHFERDNPNLCVQTNIENDWILIEIDDKLNSKPSKDEASTRAAVLASARKSRTSKQQSRSKPLEKLQSQEESFVVDPPECFKNTSPDCRDVKTSSLENLLIEHPSMSVFDNLFTKRVAPVPAKTEVQAKQKPSAKPVVPKKADKENGPNCAVNKKKSSEAPSVTVLSASNQNKALTAAVHTGEKLAKKKCISKKNFQRQNKVAMQRNKPMIRQVKMFVHQCGSLHSRNQC